MRELALFAGAGGGILGGYLLGWECVCAVEIEEYPRRVLLARQRDGILPRFPIWDDVRTFDGTEWRGRVDVISGGFPCQDIANSGTRLGLAGERSGLWSEFCRIICEVRPEFVFVENSADIVYRGLCKVLGDLAALGYDARWGVFSAADVGAQHRRERMFCVASRNGFVCAPRSWDKFERSQPQDAFVLHSAGGEDFEASFISLAEEHSRMDDGLAYPVDAVRCVGNGQVPAVVRLAWNALTGGGIA